MNEWRIMKTCIVKIKDKEYLAYIAESEDEKIIGLSNCSELELIDNKEEAMLFPYDKPQHLDFWMKNCDLDLSIIFLDDNKIVISNQHGIPNSEEYISEDDTKYVLEINYTNNIKPGDQVEFNLGINTEELDPNKLHVLNEDGTVQASIDSGSRIFSRHSTAIMIKKAKKAFESKSDVDYKDLGRYVFEELDRQDNRPDEFVDSPNTHE